MRALFICKKNETYGFTSYTRRSSGLYNSTRFIVESMRARGIHAWIIEVNDNNDIDREVTHFKPDLVVLEALWVVPSKMFILKALHPRVKWAVHLHSHIPFLALEGIAMEWIRGYLLQNIDIIANSKELYKALLCAFPFGGLAGIHLKYLPNVYVPEWRRHHLNKCEVLDVSCFGAVRPLKNHLIQALAAIQFAKDEGKPLYFHINASRIETHGEPVMKNLVQLFSSTEGANLVQHVWHEPADFVRQQSLMDISMQVSLSETFNVVTADAVAAGTPIVVSKEIAWASRFNHAKDNCVEDIVRVMRRVHHNRALVCWNQHLLKRNSEHAIELWGHYLRDKS